ncbi:hypothetical protein [Niallia sp. 03133]|uniref:hypothetical protein n=1 Tax=Niallia sp. 03133 TaxID=3458060 RepID=UPI004043FF82
MPQDSHYVNQIIFNLLLVSTNRTTDNLEIITGDTIYPTVMNQNMCTTEISTYKPNYYIRESYLHTVRSNFIVSHNIALLVPENVPNPLLKKIMQKEEGIGSAMRQLNISSSRKIVAFGYRNKQQVTNLFNQPMDLIFNHDEDVPFKEYHLFFEKQEEPGIHLLEYFNPNILLTRTEMEGVNRDTVPIKEIDRSLVRNK